MLPTPPTPTMLFRGMLTEFKRLLELVSGSDERREPPSASFVKASKGSVFWAFVVGTDVVVVVGVVIGAVVIG